MDVYLLEEFLEKEPIRIKIDEVGRKLEVSAAILSSKQHRLCWVALLKIVMRMVDADGEEAFTLKLLTREELLSEEEHLKLVDALLTVSGRYERHEDLSTS